MPTMSRPTLLFTLFAIALVSCFSVSLNGQTTDANSVTNASSRSSRSTASAENVGRLIDDGKSLEMEGRWGEALSHYQQALKAIPENRQIKTRRSIARIHYDLNRRYADSTYVESLASMGGNNALNLYSEILLKVQSYYVNKPDWDNILRHGLACMEIALSDETFVNQNLPNIDRTKIQPAIDEMNSVLQKYKIATRQDAYTVASNVCRMMQQRLRLPIQTTVYEFTCGAIIALDPYSAFMTSNQYGETMSQIEGNFVGLGVELKTHNDHLEIVSVIPKGPAGLGGLKAGDRIIAVDGTSVTQLGGDVAADALRGSEGSFIELAIANEEKQDTLRLQRRQVAIPSVENISIVDKKTGVGYLKLSNFQKTTVADFDAALWQLQKQGMRSLIVDVRGNPGGLLNAAVDISDRFLTNGVIVSTRGRNPLEDYVHQAKRAGTWQIPLVVLIDENSASASEIFAAAMGDHSRAKIVGHQSYGKGSVQGIFSLNVGGGGVRLTTAKFFSPDGSPISQIGVMPDVPVQTVAKTTAEPVAARATSIEDDAALRVAIGLAQQ